MVILDGGCSDLPCELLGGFLGTDDLDDGVRDFRWRWYVKTTSAISNGQMTTPSQTTAMPSQPVLNGVGALIASQMDLDGDSDFRWRSSCT